MLVRILCPGPSLAGYLRDRPAADALIAVNRAAEAEISDWWVFVDSVFGRFQPQGRPRIFTLSASLARTCKRLGGPIQGFEVITERDVVTSCPSRPPWTNFSVTAAMVLAEYLLRVQAAADREIVIHGCDWSGVADWDGREDGAAGRGSYRWKNEQHVFGWVERWLRQAGIKLARAA